MYIMFCQGSYSFYYVFSIAEQWSLSLEKRSRRKAAQAADSRYPSFRKKRDDRARASRRALERGTLYPRRNIESISFMFLARKQHEHDSDMEYESEGESSGSDDEGGHELLEEDLRLLRKNKGAEKVVCFCSCNVRYI